MTQVNPGEHKMPIAPLSHLFSQMIQRNINNQLLSGYLEG
jgi:hypothetical protein